jgi:hypothetical protein
VRWCGRTLAEDLQWVRGAIAANKPSNSIDNLVI